MSIEQAQRKLITAKRLRHEYMDNRSDMTLHRWIHDPDLNFPQPIYIRKKRFWFEDSISEWFLNQAEKCLGERATQ